MNLEHLQSICLPIGFMKTASQPLAYTLTAHPNVVMSNMDNSVRGWWNGGEPLSIDTFFSGVLEMNRKMFANEIKYDRKIRHYPIPNQWQGRFEQLSVIGDCSPYISTRILSKRHCEPLEAFSDNVKLPLKFIFLVRNPYDIISSAVINSYWRKTQQEKFDVVIYDFLDSCKQVERLLPRVEMLPDQHALSWYLEDYIENPKQKLTELCEFLNIESSESYLDACAKIFYKKVSKSRHLIKWSEKHKALITKTIPKYEFFSRYSWDS